MFSQGGLSLDQAPPISVVLRFFVTASIFGILLGLFLLSQSLKITTLSSYSTQLIVIHTLSLGVMASFMLGALFQMLPVLAGVVIKTPTTKAMMVHGLLSVGVLVQLFAFGISSNSLLFFLALAYLGSALFYAIYLMLKELLKIKIHSSSSKGILLALFSLIVTTLFGIYLLLTDGGFIIGAEFSQVKELHYSFALFGWVSLLIVSVSFQVIEMFYVTPAYPKSMSRYITVTVLALLLLKTILVFLGYPSTLLTATITLLFLAYSTVTIDRLTQRKRPVADATVWFWLFGMALFILSMTITFIGSFLTINSTLQHLSYIAFISFALSIVFAMVYKIVPFLTWFHLSNQGYMEAPMMHDVIHPKKAKIHFYIHVTTIFIWILTIKLTILGSLLLTISFSWLFYNLIFAVKKYTYTQKHCERIEW